MNYACVPCLTAVWPQLCFMEPPPPSNFADATGLKSNCVGLEARIAEHTFCQIRLIQKMVSPTAKFSQPGAKQHVTNCSTQLWVSFRVTGNSPAAKFCQEMVPPTAKFSLAGAICLEW